MIIVSVANSSPERSFPIFLALLPLACYRSTFVVPQFTFPDLLFRILTPLICCSAFYHLEFIVPRFAIPDLLLRVLPFQICCSIFRVPAFCMLLRLLLFRICCSMFYYSGFHAPYSCSAFRRSVFYHNP